MARFDKIDPRGGSYRAKLGFAPVAGDVGKVIPVEINGSGLAVKAAANSTSARGVICLSSLLAQGSPVDVMTDGEIVDVSISDVTGAAAGVVAKVGSAGTVTNVGTGSNVGWFVEAWRLIVRFGRA